MTEQAVHTSGPAQGQHVGLGLLGRRRELAALRADIGRSSLDTLAGRPVPRSRVLLVVGRPGSGRTALAEEFARRRVAAGEYPDGVLRARLTDPGGAPVPVERAARDLLDGMGVAAPAGAGDEEVADVLRQALARRRALLLLDDVASTEQLTELTPDHRGCLVLAVADGPLTGVPDVRPCTVGALDQEAAVALLTRGAGEVRVTVDPRATERLAEACGHLPGPLLLAGGWLAARPDAAVADAVQQLAEPPDDGLGSTGDDPLTRAFRLAHAALPPPAARMLRLLALTPAGLADAHTAGALAGCSVGTARAVLRDLAGLGLLRRVPPVQYAVPGCLDGLLRMLLEAHERPDDVLLARARMLERTVRQLRACVAVTEPVGSPARSWLAGLPGSLRFESQAAAAGWLESRLAGLLASARLAVTGGQLDTLARRLIAQLSSALAAHRGPRAAAPELYRLHELVLDVAGRQRLPREQAAALLNLGDLDSRTGRLDDALHRYRAALEAARSAGEPGDPQAVARALESLGGTYAELQDWPRAADWYGRALTWSQSRRDLDAEARLHGRIGAVRTFEGHWGAALRAWRSAAAAHRRRDDGQAHARALAEAARVQEYAGRPEESLRTCHEALRVADGAGDKRLRGALRLRLADAAARLGRHSEAAAQRAVAERLLRRPLGEHADAAPAPEVSAAHARHAGIGDTGWTYET